MKDTGDRQARILGRIIAEHRADPHEVMGEEQLRLHATLHTVVETQLGDPELPFVAATLRRLVAGGLSRHEAIHAISDVVTAEVTQALQKGKAYDEARYRHALGEVSVESYRRAEAAREEVRPVTMISSEVAEDEGPDELIVKMKVEGDEIDL
ncbi:MAG: hypothetical protein KAI47_19745 [Deltaproteobacteria bacterium]|nr:hypothetical protein [Deltaproteobacteria bacterium]